MMRNALVLLFVALLATTVSVADDVQLGATAQGAPEGMAEFLDGIAILTYPNTPGLPKPMQLLNGTVPRKSGSFKFPEIPDVSITKELDRSSVSLGKWVDKCSPALLSVAGQGQAMDELSITIDAGDGTELTLNFEKLEFLSVQLFAPGFGDRNLPSTQPAPRGKALLLVKLLPSSVTWTRAE